MQPRTRSWPMPGPGRIQNLVQAGVTMPPGNAPPTPGLALATSTRTRPTPPPVRADLQTPGPARAAPQLLTWLATSTALPGSANFNIRREDPRAKTPAHSNIGLVGGSRLEKKWGKKVGRVVAILPWIDTCRGLSS